MTSLAAETRCQDASAGLDEPLPGTAVANTSRWLLLEHPEQWERKALRSAGISVALSRWLNEAERRVEGLRIQLIRRPGGRASGGRRVFLGHSAGREPQVWSRELETLDAIQEVDLQSWVQGREPAGFERHDDPLYLVCVHGKRDRCCARLGMPVFSALAAQRPGQVWQTSHLGGHRFAATLLCLPEAVCYGRVTQTEVPALVAAHAEGRLHDLERFRGRTCHEAVVQAAEACLRAKSGEMSIHGVGDARVEPASADGSEHLWRVRFEGTAHVVMVRREGLGPLVKSCGTEPEMVPVHRCEVEAAHD